MICVTKVKEVFENAARVKLGELQTGMVLVGRRHVILAHKLVDMRVHQELILVLQLPLAVVDQIDFSVYPFLFERVNQQNRISETDVVFDFS